MKRLLPLTLLLIFVCSPAWGADYYIDITDTGSTNQGSYAEPYNSWSTVNTALDGASAGDGFYFKAGATHILTGPITPDASGSSGNHITIGAYDGDGDFDVAWANRPILNGAVGTLEWPDPSGAIPDFDSAGESYRGVIWILNQSHITVQDLNITNSGVFGIYAHDGTEPLDDSGSIWIKRCTVDYANMGGILLGRQNIGYPATGYLSQGGLFPGNPGVDVAQTVNGPQGSKLCTYSLVEDCEIKYVDRLAAERGNQGASIGIVGSRNVLVRRNKCSTSRGEGIGIYANCWPVTARYTGWSTIEYNYIWDQGRIGSYLAMVRNVNWRYNLIDADHTNDTYDGISGYPRKQDNLYDSKLWGRGLNIGHETEIEDCGGPAGGLTHDIWVYGNIFTNLWTGLSFGNEYGAADTGMDNIKVYNNTFVNCYEAVYWAGYSYLSMAGSSGGEFKNNIIYNVDADNPPFGSNTPSANFTGDYNMYESTQAVIPDALEGAHDQYETTPSISKTTGWDDITGGAQSGAEVALQEGSPAIDTALDLGDTYTMLLNVDNCDFSTDPITLELISQERTGDTLWDIGADIYETESDLNENNFDNEDSVEALYNWEYNELITDSKNSHDLTADDAATADTINYWQGVSSVRFTSSNENYYTITDWGWVAGETISISTFYRPMSSGNREVIIGKFDINGDQRTFLFRKNTSDQLEVVLNSDGTSSGNEYYNHLSVLTCDGTKTYMVSFSYERSSKTLTIRIRDESDNSKVGNDYSTTTTSQWYNGTAKISIGAGLDSGGDNWNYLNANLDEAALWSKMLNSNDLDALVAGEYGIPGRVYFSGDHETLHGDTTTSHLDPFTNPDDYDYVEVDDDTYMSQSATDEFSIFIWKDKNSNNTDTIKVSYTGKSSIATSIQSVYLQIYNQNSSTWEQLDYDNSTAADTEFTLVGIIVANVGNYYDESYWITCRVYQHSN